MCCRHKYHMTPIPMTPDQPDRKPKPGKTYSSHNAFLFTSAQACEAAQIDQKTLENWFSRAP
jgi:hypothetical protein